MSLLKSNSVQIGQSATATQNFTLSVPSSPDGTIKLARGNSGATTADILSVSSSGAVTINNLNNQSFRNRIINGEMRIDQRNAGASSTPATDSYTYTSLDRYFTSVNTPATSTAIRSTNAPPSPAPVFMHSLKMGRSGSGTAGLNTFGQVIETDNCKDLAGSPVTLSFWAKVGASATFSSLNAYIYSGTTADQSAASLRGGWTGQATVASTTVTLTTTWTKFSITGTAGSSALQLAAQFVFTTVGAAGADDNLYITGVQLEAGSTATEFERRPIGTELALCQRYYVRYAETGQRFYGGRTEGTTFGIPAWSLPVEMRAIPTAATGTIGGITLNDGGVNAVATSLTSQFCTSKLLAVGLTSSGGMTNFRSLFVTFVAGSYLDASAEL